MLSTLVVLGSTLLTVAPSVVLPRTDRLRALPSLNASMPAIAAAVAADGRRQCPDVQPIPALDNDRFIEFSWFIQQQQINGYQPRESLFCLVQTLELEGREVPFFDGTVISVYNYGNMNEVNGPPSNDDNQTLCARQEDPADRARIINAPCFLPNVLAGPYWVVAADVVDYEWAIVSGGAPTEVYDDGCTTRLEGVNDAGLWLFSRTPVAPAEQVEAMRAVLRNMGYTLQELLPVVQAGCRYEGARLKVAPTR